MFSALNIAMCFSFYFHFSLLYSKLSRIYFPKFQNTSRVVQDVLTKKSMYYGAGPTKLKAVAADSNEVS